MVEGIMDDGIHGISAQFGGADDFCQQTWRHLPPQPEHHSGIIGMDEGLRIIVRTDEPDFLRRRMPTTQRGGIFRQTGDLLNEDYVDVALFVACTCSRRVFGICREKSSRPSIRSTGSGSGCRALFRPDRPDPSSSGR
jgi:hypothetical protein